MHLCSSNAEIWFNLALYFINFYYKNTKSLAIFISIKKSEVNLDEIDYLTVYNYKMGCCLHLMNWHSFRLNIVTRMRNSNVLWGFIRLKLKKRTKRDQRELQPNKHIGWHQHLTINPSSVARNVPAIVFFFRLCLSQTSVKNPGSHKLPFEVLNCLLSGF